MLFYFKCLFLLLRIISFKLFTGWHLYQVKNRNSDVSLEGLSINRSETELLPVLRSGAWTDIGSRSTMEDVYVCTDDFKNDYGLKSIDKGPSAFYGVKVFSL